MPRLQDVYANPQDPHCKFAGTELLDRQGYYSALVLVLEQKLRDDGVPHRSEVEFSERHEIVQQLAKHLENFEQNLTS